MNLDNFGTKFWHIPALGVAVGFMFGVFLDSVFAKGYFWLAGGLLGLIIAVVGEWAVTRFLPPNHEGKK